MSHHHTYLSHHHTYYRRAHRGCPASLQDCSVAFWPLDGAPEEEVRCLFSFFFLRICCLHYFFGLDSCCFVSRYALLVCVCVCVCACVCVRVCAPHARPLSLCPFRSSGGFVYVCIYVLCHIIIHTMSHHHTYYVVAVGLPQSMRFVCMRGKGFRLRV